MSYKIMSLCMIIPTLAFLGFRTNYCYEYHRVSESFSWGQVDYWIYADSKIINEGKKQRILGAPYYLCVHPNKLRFVWDYYEVSNLSLRNLDTDQVFDFQKERRGHMGTMRDTGQVTSYHNLELPYNDYEMTGIITFFKDEKKIRNHEINIRFKRRYRKTFTSDIIDRMWSI